MSIRVSGLSLAELKILAAKVADTIPRARAREISEVRAEFARIAEAHGLTIDDVSGSKPVQRAKHKRRPAVLVPMKDRVTGVIWVGRGRRKKGFDINRAEAVTSAMT